MRADNMPLSLISFTNMPDDVLSVELILTPSLNHDMLGVGVPVTPHGKDTLQGPQCTYSAIGYWPNRVKFGGIPNKGNAE